MCSCRQVQVVFTDRVRHTSPQAIRLTEAHAGVMRSWLEGYQEKRRKERSHRWYRHRVTREGVTKGTMRSGVQRGRPNAKKCCGRVATRVRDAARAKEGAAPGMAWLPESLALIRFHTTHAAAPCRRRVHCPQGTLCSYFAEKPVILFGSLLPAACCRLMVPATGHGAACWRSARARHLSGRHAAAGAAVAGCRASPR